MAIAFVNSAVAFDASSSTTIACAAFSVTTGNTIVVSIASYTLGGYKTVTGITDTAGNTYTICGAGYNSDSNRDMEIWVATNITGNASNVVTATFSDTASNRHIAACQYSGLATSNVYDAGSTGKEETSVTTDHTTNTAVTSVADEVIVGWFNLGNSLPYAYSASSPYTIRATNPFDYYSCVVDQIVSSTGTYSVTVSTSSTNKKVSIARTFKMQAGTPEPLSTNITSMRVIWFS